MQKKKKKFIKPTVKLCDYDDIEMILAGSDTPGSDPLGSGTKFSWGVGGSSNPNKDKSTQGGDGSGDNATWFPGGF